MRSKRVSAEYSLLQRALVMRQQCKSHNQAYMSCVTQGLCLADCFCADHVLQDVVDKIQSNLQRSAQTQKLFAAVESRDRSVVETNFERVNFWSAVQMVAMVTAAAINVIVIRGLFDDRRSTATATKLRT